MLGGFASFAPWSFGIKGLTAVAVATVAGMGSTARVLPVMLLGALLTVVGYAIATAVMFGPEAAIAETLGNTIQVGAGVLVASVLVPVVRRAMRR